MLNAFTGLSFLPPSKAEHQGINPNYERDVTKLKLLARESSARVARLCSRRVIMIVNAFAFSIFGEYFNLSLIYVCKINFSFPCKYIDNQIVKIL